LYGASQNDATEQRGCLEDGFRELLIDEQNGVVTEPRTYQLIRHRNLSLIDDSRLNFLILEWRPFHSRSAKTGNFDTAPRSHPLVHALLERDYIARTTNKELARPKRPLIHFARSAVRRAARP
jgi:hypothetical protein